MALGRQAFRDLYEQRREWGQTHDQARVGSFIDGCREDELNKRSSGVDYDEVHVRQATVHVREDLWIVCYRLNELTGIAKGIRWRLTAMLVMLVLIALSRV